MLIRGVTNYNNDSNHFDDANDANGAIFSRDFTPVVSLEIACQVYTIGVVRDDILICLALL